MRHYFLYAAVTVSGSDLAHIDIIENGHIVGIQGSLSTAAASANGDLIRVQCSLASAYLETNDLNNVLAVMASGVASALITALPAVNMYVGPIAVPVKVADRVYLHATEAGGSTWHASFIVHFQPSKR